MRIDCKTLSLSACLFALLCLSSVGYASPPSADVHFCRVLDFEDMQERDSLYAAPKQTFNLNAGEPRTVRMIYFLPNDRPFRQEVVDSMKVTIRQIQTFYAEQMQAHGYRNKTFRFETDAEGEPMVHRVDGQHPDSHYLDNTHFYIYNEIGQAFDLNANIYFLVIDNSTGLISRRAVGTAIRQSKNSGTALVPGEFIWRTAAHELGHAFGLAHDFNDDAYIMSYGGDQRRSLSACNAEFLAAHPYFNPDIPIEKGPPPTIELISPRKYPADSKSVSVQLRVNDLEELHQVLLFVLTRPPHSAAGYLEVKACRGLDDVRDAVVEFNYDGVIPSDGGTSLSNPNTHLINVVAVDTEGNVRGESFGLWNSSTERNIIVILEGHGGRITSVVFSPDGTILASGSVDNTIKLWDVATGTNITTLEGYAGEPGNLNLSVAFSPDGTILASGSADNTIKLWDVATGTNITTLEQVEGGASVAFSPDGTMLASASYDHTVKLWDVATRTNTTTLSGHMRLVTSVAFSPDGTIFASGSADNTIKLWDVVTGTNIATLDGHTSWILSVAFSPDGTMLASASYDHTVKLWDVATRTNIATLDGYVYWMESVAFSPDGTTLASTGQDRTVRLWDIATGTNIAILEGHTSGGYSVAFSPDGTMLASASHDRTIRLWDMSDYVTPVVNIPDANLRAVIRDALDKSRFAPITVKDMASLTALDASNRNIRDLTGLEPATNLTTLNLVDNPLSAPAINTHIPALQERGVEVLFDKTPTPDFDGDGIIGIGDFLIFVAQFGFSEGGDGYDAQFDLDGDGMIGISDFLIFANAFGKAVSSN